MPLKAPAEKAILGANQFKFQLTQDRKACAALTSLAVHEIAGLIICSCTSNPTPFYTHTHTLPLSFSHPWGEALISAFSWKQLSVIIGVYTVNGWGAYLPQDWMNLETPCISVHVYPFHMHTNICTHIHTILCIQKHSAHTSDHHTHTVTLALTGMQTHKWAQRYTGTPTYWYTHTQRVVFACWLRLSEGKKHII